MRAAKLWLDAFQQQAKEQVLPGLGVAQSGAGGGGQRARIAGRGQQVGANMAGEGLGDGQAVETGQIAWSRRGT